MNKLKFKKPFVLWFTGLSGSGKTTLGKKIFKYLKKQNINIEFLDGDLVRKVLPNTGFTKQARLEHISRMGYIASILEKNGISTIAAFISPHKSARKFVRKLCRNFIEVYLSTPIKICLKRDVKGLYKKAQKGKLKYFTGISDCYEKPDNPELIIDTSSVSIEKAFVQIISYLKTRNFIK